VLVRAAADDLDSLSPPTRVPSLPPPPRRPRSLPTVPLPSLASPSQVPLPRSPYVVLIDGPGFCHCVDFSTRVLAPAAPPTSAGQAGAGAAGASKEGTTAAAAASGAPAAPAGRPVHFVPAHQAAAVHLVPIPPGTAGASSSPTAVPAPTTAREDRRRYCKHLLAAVLADALGDRRCAVRDVSEEDLVAILAGGA
jgi:hypothetical protein